MINKNKYTEAFQYVDSSKISMDDLKEIGNLATHYELGAVYMEKTSKGNYIFGFKPISTDKMNEKNLEFMIIKKKNQWKVINYGYFKL